MTSFPILAAGFIISVIAVLFVICAIALVLIVLIQKGRGGGLSGVLAGGMASGILGSKTGDFLTWVTIGLAVVFLFLAVVMAKFYKPTVSDFGPGPAAQQAPIQQEQPVESPIPSTESPIAAENADANSIE